MAADALVVWTVGHSSRSMGDFLALLRTSAIECIADVRRYPGSRAHPHFNAGPLAETLAGERIDYLPMPELGGRRRARPDSPNTVWRNASFRGYADYMQTPDFDAALARFARAASARKTALMCSEAVWWRCHRALIADVLKASGARVLHIMDGRTVEHPFTTAARLVDGRLDYGAGEAQPGPQAGTARLFAD